MKTLRVVFYLAIWLGVTFDLAAVAENQPPAEGAPLPAINLPAPKDADHGAYLGVTGRGLDDDAAVAEYVVISVVQRHAPGALQFLEIGRAHV
jgi:hypothetical protein